MTGLILKLKGYYNFLKIYPEYREKVVLFQVIRGLFFKSDKISYSAAPIPFGGWWGGRRGVESFTSLSICGAPV